MITSTNIRSANKFKKFVELRVPDSPIASLQLTSWQPILDDKNKSISLLWEPNSIFIFVYCIVIQPGYHVTCLQTKNIKPYDCAQMFHDVLTPRAVTS